MASLDDFPSCCGAMIYHDFDYGTHKQKFVNGILYVAILNDAQIDRHSDHLKKKGFRLVSDSLTNRNSGNRLYLYVRDGKEVKVKQVKKRMFA